MAMSVLERGRFVATSRFVSVRLMETVAAWTPTTPEMEVKIVMGRHIWDFAQQADALGRRTFELRMPAQHSLRPSDAYVALLEDVRAREGAAERLTALYDAVLPGLVQRYDRYLAATDRLLDEPTVRIVEQIASELRRQIGEAHDVRSVLGIPRGDALALAEREQASPLVAVA